MRTKVAIALAIVALVALWLTSNWYSARSYVVAHIATNTAVMSEMGVAKPDKISVHSTGVQFAQEPITGIRGPAFTFDLKSPRGDAVMQVATPLPLRLFGLEWRHTYRIGSVGIED